MRRSSPIPTLIPLLAALGCGDTPSPTGATAVREDVGPDVTAAAAEFSPGVSTRLTTSSFDHWPELEGDLLAWYRSAPADEEGVWLMDLRTGDARRIWAGTVLSAFDLADGEVVWGSAAGLHSFSVESGVVSNLADGFRNYRDVEAGARYVIGTATQSSARPLVYDRATGNETLIPTPTSVPATRGWGDWVLWSDHRESLSKRDLFLWHIPTGVETQVTNQAHFLSSANAALHGDRVVYFARRFCPGPLEVYLRSTGEITPLPLPEGITCPVVVELEGDILIYRHSASASVIQLGFLDLAAGTGLTLPMPNPGNGRIDADLDGTRVVHTSAQGLTLLDLRLPDPEPPVAAAGGPYRTPEGARLTLDGTGSRSAHGGALRYRWDMGDGTVLEGSATPTHIWADDGTYTVRLTVWDEGGLSADSEATVVVSNQPPAVMLSPLQADGPGAASSEIRIRVGELVTLTLAIADPGPADGPWNWTVTWDDGEVAAGEVSEPGTVPALTWRPPRPGSITLTATARDKDGGSGRAALVLVVEPAVLPIPIRVGTGPGHSVPASTGNGAFPVVILGTDAVPVSTMDRAGFRLGAGAARPIDRGGLAPAEEDVDGDGRPDLRLHFRAWEAGLEPGDTEVCLLGVTLDGTGLRGCGPASVRGQGSGG
ncbi:MAG: PKD domain-containing protein [Longimicrobiales bacterium]|nr:PKD domain-containing protein [Longimicrobiales bacterium]